MDLDVVQGDFQKPAHKSSNIIRLFVSSTFTDMSVERNVLMTETYPKLTKFFREQGFQFQVVDMRWGVREEAVMENMASKLCIQEIQNAQEVSRGVCFLALLGDKYGNCPLPATMSVRHFRLFRHHLKDVGAASAEILDEWYKLDENAMPSHYILLPRSEKLQHIHSNQFDDIESRINERSQWDAEQVEIRQLLQRAADISHRKGDISEEERHRYYMAVTECEILKGILEDEKAEERTVAVFRQFKHFNPHHAKQQSCPHRYADVQPNGVNPASALYLQTLIQKTVPDRYADIQRNGINPASALHLQTLKQKKVPSRLSPTSISSYKISWTENGVDPSVREHAEYLRQLSEAVFNQIKDKSMARINRYRQQEEISDPDEKSWYQDIVHHHSFCREKVKMFHGQLKTREHINRIIRKIRYATQRPKITRIDLTTKKKAGDGETDDNSPAVEDSKDSKTATKPDELSDEIAEVGNKSDPEDGLNNDSESDSEDSSGGKQKPKPKLVTCNKPIILYADSGYGKTSLMARVISKMGLKEGHKVQWLEAPTVIRCIRFLGTSPLSCQISDVLISVIRQIHLALGIDGPEEMPQKFSRLSEYFYELLWSMEERKDVLLVIGLDALDQLTDTKGLSWLPLNVPENVFIIISTLDHHPIIESIRGILMEEKCYVTMQTMGRSSGWGVIQIYANADQRTFTQQQMNCIIDAFSNSSFPMYLKLAYDLSKDWKSFTPVTSLVLGKNCKELINQLLERLKFQHGKVASNALKFLTASRDGLTDQEIEDLLSISDNVLQDVYIYHLPVDSSVIRLPPMLWRRVRHQIWEYLVEKEVDDTTVINWYHRQFWEAARFHLADTPHIHKTMIQYYTGYYHKQPKPLCLFKGKKAEYSDCYRNVPAMPYEYGPNIPNLRKLNELPYHCILSFNMNLAGQLLCTFNFLLFKLRYCGLSSLLSDFKLFFHTYSPGESDEKFADLVLWQKMRDMDPDSVTSVDMQHIQEKISNPVRLDVKILYDCLSTSSDIIHGRWESLPFNIVARLDDSWMIDHRLKKLKKDALIWINGYSEPLIVPGLACMPSPAALLRTSINHTLHIPGRGKHFGPNYLANTLYLSPTNNWLYVNEQRWNAPDIVNVYDLENNGELIQSISLRLCVQKFRFVMDQKYVLVKSRKSRFQTTASQDRLIEMELKEPVAFDGVEAEDDVHFILPDSTGSRFVLVVHGGGTGTSSRISKYDLRRNAPPALVHSFSPAEFYSKEPIILASLSPNDATAVVITKDGRFHVYDLEGLKWTHTGVGYPIDTEAGQEIENISTLEVHWITRDSFIIRGIRSDLWSDAFVYDCVEGELQARCHNVDNQYCLDIIRLHKGGRCAAGATRYTIEGSSKASRAKPFRPILVWDVDKGKLLAEFKEPSASSGAIQCIEFLGDQHQYLAASRVFNNGISIYHFDPQALRRENFYPLITLSDHVKSVVSLVTDATERLLVTGSADNTIKVYDLSTTLTLAKLNKGRKRQSRRQSQRKSDAENNNNNKGRDRYVIEKDRFCATRNPNPFKDAAPHSLELSHEEDILICSFTFGMVAFITLATGEYIKVQGHRNTMRRIQLKLTSPGYFTVISSAKDSAFLWNYTNGTCLRRFILHDGIAGMAFSNGLVYFSHYQFEDPEAPDSKCYFQFWDLTKRADEMISEKYRSANCFAILTPSEDNRHVLSWNGYEPILMDIASGQVLELKPDDSEIEGDNPTTTNENGEVIVTERNIDRATFCEFSVDGRYGIAISFRTIYIINVERQTWIKVFCETVVRSFRCLANAPEWGLIGRYRNLEVVNLVHGAIVQRMVLHEGFVTCLRMNAAESVCVTLSDDRKLKFWTWAWMPKDREQMDELSQKSGEMRRAKQAVIAEKKRIKEEEETAAAAAEQAAEKQKNDDSQGLVGINDDSQTVKGGSSSTKNENGYHEPLPPNPEKETELEDKLLTTKKEIPSYPGGIASVLYSQEDTTTIAESQPEAQNQAQITSPNAASDGLSTENPNCLMLGNEKKAGANSNPVENEETLEDGDEVSETVQKYEAVKAELQQLYEAVMGTMEPVCESQFHCALQLVAAPTDLSFLVLALNTKECPFGFISYNPILAERIVTAVAASSKLVENEAEAPVVKLAENDEAPAENGEAPAAAPKIQAPWFNNWLSATTTGNNEGQEKEEEEEEGRAGGERDNDDYDDEGVEADMGSFSGEAGDQASSSVRQKKDFKTSKQKEDSITEDELDNDDLLEDWIEINDEQINLYFSGEYSKSFSRQTASSCQTISGIFSHNSSQSSAFSSAGNSISFPSQQSSKSMACQIL